MSKMLISPNRCSDSNTLCKEYVILINVIGISKLPSSKTNNFTASKTFIIFCFVARNAVVSVKLAKFNANARSLLIASDFNRGAAVSVQSGA